MKISAPAAGTLKRLANDYAAAGFGPYETWVLRRMRGRSSFQRALGSPNHPTLRSRCADVPFHGARTEVGHGNRNDLVKSGGPAEITGDSAATSVLDDVTRVLLHLSNAGRPPRQGHSTLEGAALVGPLNLTPERINDAVDILEENGLVETGRYLGTHPFAFKDVGQGRCHTGNRAARYRYREELFPTLTFRRTYDALRAIGSRADVEYLRILHLGVSTMQSTVEQTLVALLDASAPIDFEAVRARVSPPASPVPIIAIPAPDLRAYDHLLVGGAA